MFLGGIMHYIELDVRNLKRWLEGAIGVSGSAAMNQNGYIIYFSDRRTNRDAANNETGEYGFEDFVNPANADGTPNGVLDTGEDVNADGQLDTYGQVPTNVPAGCHGAAHRRCGTNHAGDGRRGQGQPSNSLPPGVKNRQRWAQRRADAWFDPLVRKPGLPPGRLQCVRRSGWLRGAELSGLDSRRRGDAAVEQLERLAVDNSPLTTQTAGRPPPCGIAWRSWPARARHFLGPRLAGPHKTSAPTAAYTISCATSSARMVRR